MGDSRERSAERACWRERPGKSRRSGARSGGTSVQNPQLQFAMLLLTAEVGRKSCAQQNGCLGCEVCPGRGGPETALVR